jgi:sigma-B regulation protein RsbU (phosphoserine phosphatase)
MLIDSALPSFETRLPCPAEFRRSWDRELANAHAVQQRLLPRDLPPLNGLDFSAVCRQAHAVGGDFYDLFPLPGGELGIAIGDVCGKGLGAALMMAHLKATLRVEASHNPACPASVIDSVNRMFHEASAADLYATLFYATYDPSTRLLKYVNAGHNAPLLLRRDHHEPASLQMGGPPVGMFLDCAYEQGWTALSPGDVLVAYTDGVTESRNFCGEEWGTDSILEIVRAGHGTTAAALCARIAHAVDRFSFGADQADDMTWLVLLAA